MCDFGFEERASPSSPSSLLSSPPNEEPIALGLGRGGGAAADLVFFPSDRLNISGGWEFPTATLQLLAFPLVPDKFSSCTDGRA